MMKRLLISIYFTLSVAFMMSATDILHLQEHRYNVQSGLVDNEINSMLQDRNGLIWFGTNNGISCFDAYQFRNFSSNYRHPDFFMSNKVLDMDADSTNIWFVTQKGLECFDQVTLTTVPVKDTLLQKATLKSVLILDDGRILTGGTTGLFIYDPLTGHNEILSISDKEDQQVVNIRDLYKDRYGNIWVGTWGKGLYQMLNGSTQVRKVRIPSLDDGLIMTSFAEGKEGNMYIGTWGSGIIRLSNFSSNDMEVSFFAIPKNDPHHIDWNIIFDLEVSASGFLCAGSPKGLRIFKETGSRLEEVEYCIDGDSSKNRFHEVKSIYKDNAGAIWVSDYGGGVVSLLKKQSVVDEISLTQAGLNSNCVMAVYQDKDEILWLGINGQGVIRYDQNKKVILNDRQLQKIDAEGNAAVAFVPVTSRNLLFISTRYYGVYMLSLRDGLITDVKHFNTDTRNIRNAFTDHAVKDMDDNIWVATKNGVVILRPQDGHKDEYVIYEPAGINKAISYVPVKSLCPDANGGMWLGTDEGGIIHLPAGLKNESSCHFYNVGNGKLNGKTSSCIYQDRKGRVWAGSKGSGLSLFDPQDDCFNIVENMHLFPSEEISSISEDNRGRLWISTNNGIVCYDPDSSSDKIKSYGSVNGLSNLSFMPNSVWTNHQKVVYGGYDGLSIFSVNDLFERKSSSKTIITDISIFNNSISNLPVEEREKYTDLMPPYATRINLGWKDKSVSFTFASPDFINSAHVRYAYQLEGLDKEWHYVTSSGRNVTYNNLSRGEYTFRVKAAGPSGIWTEPSNIIVKVIPAPWLSSGAIAGYVLLTLVAFCIIFYSINSHLRLRQELEIEQIERLKSDEVNNAKLTFFTNVSHEIFTPLTIMSVSLEKLMEKNPDDHSLNRIIISNMDRLKRLLQQIMEFRKAESSNLQLRVTETDIVSFVKRLCDENFLPLAETDKKIDMVFSAACEHLIGYVDSDKLDKILYNLISNAYKYNRKDGSVIVTVSVEDTAGRYAIISVRDTGYGISRKKQEGLFKRFYEGDYREFNTSGTGIGLALTKDLVNLHKGTISVQSIEGEGSVFTIRIPIDRDFYSDEQIYSHIQTERLDDGPSEFSKDRSTLLLVEDNEEFLFLMKNIMSEHYNIFTARNGKEAISVLAKGAEIDLIITDLMMPEMDGAQFCRIIRSDIKYSHLPVIMLSARSIAECKLESFAAGVDAYVAKPFEINILKAQVDGLIANRKMLVDNYRKNQNIEEDSIINTDLDRQFIEKAVKLIEEHISEPEFNINEFNIAMSMSGSTLYRKIKGLTGMSPKEFIRNIRFKYACRLLLEKSSNISEVAYRVGFSDAKYFSLCFKKEFGMTPSKYISINRKDSKIDIE